MCLVYDKTLSEDISMAGPTQPTRAGNFSFVDCWTDEKSDRTLSPAGNTGAIDVDTCASFCDGFQYMGTEYSDECKHDILYSKPIARQFGSVCSRRAADLFFTQAIVETC